ncbi:MAG: AI-2E family transporter [Halobacteriales archaeon]|nr:AI-2E family transporter [Halobacteriales archaeon]
MVTRLLPDTVEGRKLWLFVLLILISVISLIALSEVFWTIFLAAVFAYVLYPVKERVGRGRLSDRQSAAIVTMFAFLLLITLVLPVFFVLFRRRQRLIGFISSLPEEITVEVSEFTYTYPTSQIVALARDWITSAAVSLASSLPSLSLKAFLFVFLLYAILKHPRSVERKMTAILPDSSANILYSYHDRIKKTLVGIFAVQTITSFVTFMMALPVFYFLGYDAFMSLALIAGALQFIPILGPSILILALVALELSAGFVFKAAVIFVFGIVVIGFLPDAYLRPLFADRTTGLPPSLYFIGFAGGALTLGAIGVLVGPLIIAVLLETTELITE